MHKTLKQFRKQNGLEFDPGNIAANLHKEISELLIEVHNSNEIGMVEESCDLYILCENALEAMGHDARSHFIRIGNPTQEITPNQLAGFTSQFLGEWILNCKIESLAAIATLAMRCIECLGYHSSKCIKEKAKVICSRKGSHNHVTKKWEKDESQCKSELYQPNYKGCKK